MLDIYIKTAIRKLSARGISLSPINNVLLINPLQLPSEFYDSEMAEKNRYFCYPPYGLGILASLLKKYGINVHILDLNYEILKLNLPSNEDIKLVETQLLKEKLTSFKEIQLVGISCMFTLTHESFKRAITTLRSLNFNGLIASGGVHVTNDQLRIKADIPEIDLIFPNESEKTFLEFLLLTNDTEMSEEINFLDISPHYLDLPIDDYSNHGEIGAYRFWWKKGTRASTALSNRGCRAHCTFCSVEGFNGPGVRSRSIKSVIDEIEKLRDKYFINHIMWLDDDLFYDQKRTVELFNEIIRRNLKITWDASNGIIASAATDEVISASAESGCIGMHVGIESGNKDILKSIRKPSGIRHFIDLGERLKKFPQIFSRGFLIIGFPNETIGQINDTISLAKQMNLDWYTISLLSPLPSTKIYDQMIELGLINDDKIQSKDINYGSMQTGLQKKRELLLKNVSAEVMNFTNLDQTIIPSREVLEEIWFDVDYHINYSKISKESDITKLNKLQSFLQDIGNRMTNWNNPLVTHSLKLIHEKLGNEIEVTKYETQTGNLLKDSLLWKSRFKNIGVHYAT